MSDELDISTLRKGRKKEVDNTPLFMKYIKDSKELVENASKLIRKYQTKELTPIKFRRQYMNTNLLGGLYPGNVIGIAGSSGHGKSTLLQELEDDIFDDELNPTKLFLVIIDMRNNYIDNLTYWDLNVIRNKISGKMKNLLACTAIEKNINGVRYFNYNSFECYFDFNFSNFINAIKLYDRTFE